jgi:hypothetical protein
LLILPSVSDFDQRSKISAETSRDGPAVLRSQGAGADIRFVSGKKTRRQEDKKTKIREDYERKDYFNRLNAFIGYPVLSCPRIHDCCGQ